MDRTPLDLVEVREALACAVKDNDRASTVVGRIRALMQKAPERTDRVEINEALREVIELTQGEALKNGVSVKTKFAKDLPIITGDRVQLPPLASHTGLSFSLSSLLGQRDRSMVWL